MPHNDCAFCYRQNCYFSTIGKVRLVSDSDYGFAFHAVQMAGAVIWDNMPLMLGAVHAGDWLMKMLMMSVILAA